MKLARLTCPGCHREYESAVATDEYYVQCPGCGQNNNIPPSTPPITGICRNCGRPLDDHIWRGDVAVHCP